MEGTLGTDLQDADEMERRVHEELIALRGQLGRLTVQKFSQYETLRQVCGGNDLLDAFLMFERELKRYETVGRNEAAAAISISAPADTVLDRLEHAVGALPQDGKLRDQRTARRWSDDGLRVIARELVYLAEVQGRLGSELLSVEVSGDLDSGIHLIIDQMTTTGLIERSPQIRLWHYKDDEPEERSLTIELDDYPSTAAANQDHTMKRHRVNVDFPPVPDVQQETILLSVSVEGLDAPMRTVALDDNSNLPPHLRIRFSVYRTIVMMDVLLLPRSSA